jgi:hypothetical protein
MGELKTLKVTEQLKEFLQSKKIHPRETFNDVLERLLLEGKE